MFQEASNDEGKKFLSSMNENKGLYKKISYKNKTIINDKKKVNTGIQKSKPPIKKTVDDFMTKPNALHNHNHQRSYSKENLEQRSFSFKDKKPKENQIESIKNKLMESFGYIDPINTHSLFKDSGINLLSQSNTNNSINENKYLDVLNRNSEKNIGKHPNSNNNITTMKPNHCKSKSRPNIAIENNFQLNEIMEFSDKKVINDIKDKKVITRKSEAKLEHVIPTNYKKKRNLTRDFLNDGLGFITETNDVEVDVIMNDQNLFHYTNESKLQ